MTQSYDAILVVAFGGPEGREDVLPFLENVLRGRNVPPERMLAVAEHYDAFDGVSPLNQQVRDLISALTAELHEHGIDLPIYWGNRNWHPLLPETLQQMADDGVQRALALVLAAYSSYSSCRQYREDIGRAQATVGKAAPHIDKVRVWYNHPDFISANVQCVRAGIEQFDEDERRRLHIAFTAHSIPRPMADQCDYVCQLTETCRLIGNSLPIGDARWRLVYQSRSGRPQDPWLGPDICDHLRSLKEQGVEEVLVHPVGFLSDHVEVLYDLDRQAANVARELGQRMVRTSTVGTRGEFVRMLRKLIQERLQADFAREAMGLYPPSHDECPIDCCPAPVSVPTGRPTGQEIQGESSAATDD